MTPKLKAEQLVVKFLKHSRAEKDITPIQSAKQCALIAVDEIINAIRPFGNREWWQEVKNEIDKL